MKMVLLIVAFIFQSPVKIDPLQWIRISENKMLYLSYKLWYTYNITHKMYTEITKNNQKTLIDWYDTTRNYKLVENGYEKGSTDFFSFVEFYVQKEYY